MTTRTGTTVVTGAAGGIGSAIVTKLLSTGGTVVGVDLAANPVEPGDGLHWVQGDITDSGTLEAAFAAARDLGGADGLACAPFADHRAPLEQLTDAQITEVFQHQVVTAWKWGARLVTDRAEAAEDASIVHVSSVHARLALPGAGSYAMAKGALSALTRAMAVEWGPHGVRCNAVEPGFVPVARNAHRHRGPGSVEAIAGHLPLRRVVTVNDVAETVAFLLGPGAAAITGVCLPVDAGMSAAMPTWA